jgi:hypothetical protein
MADVGEAAVPHRFVPPVRPYQVNTRALGQERLELPPGKALVSDDHRPVRTRWWSPSSRAVITSRSPGFGLAGHQDTGIPSAVVSG